MSEDRLQFTEAESAFLRTWFSRGQYLEGRPVAPEAVLKALPRSRDLALATHGKFDPSKPLQSGLSLGDERALTLERLFETSGLGAPRLVVLSACETGLYDLEGLPEEFIGLPSGFIQAGAVGVIGTLWPVKQRIDCSAHGPLPRTLHRRATYTIRCIARRATLVASRTAGRVDRRSDDVVAGATCPGH